MHLFVPFGPPHTIFSTIELPHPPNISPIHSAKHSSHSSYTVPSLIRISIRYRHYFLDLVHHGHSQERPAETDVGTLITSNTSCTNKYLNPASIGFSWLQPQAPAPSYSSKLQPKATTLSYSQSQRPSHSYSSHSNCIHLIHSHRNAVRSFCCLWPLHAVRSTLNAPCSTLQWQLTAHDASAQQAGNQTVAINIAVQLSG